MTAAATPRPSLSSRRDALRDALPATVDCLHRRRAADIDSRVIDDYVALQWLEWNGGSLRLTVTGRNVCDQRARQLGPYRPEP